jgi:anti-sigma-K factor RskA
MLDRGAHIEDIAGAYALGALDAPQRARVEEHAAACGACSRALGAAESAVASLVDASVTPYEPPERLGERIAASARATPPVRAVRRFGVSRRVLALAAALVLAAGIGGGVALERASGLARDARDGAVLATLANAHFEHVAFNPRSPRAPVAKAIYARDGTWLYVIVDSGTCDCRVVARSAAGERDLGAPEPRGEVATLFVRGAARPTGLLVEDASGDVLAAATLAYPR